MSLSSYMSLCICLLILNFFQFIISEMFCLGRDNKVLILKKKKKITPFSIDQYRKSKMRWFITAEVFSIKCCTFHVKLKSALQVFRHDSQ